MQTHRCSGKLRVALLSSGLGHVKRGIESWMFDLSKAFTSECLDVELWTGASLASSSKRARSLHALRRDSPMLSGFDWHRRYQYEQLSVLPAAIVRARLGKLDLLYCGDPVLTWHLKRFQHLHGAKVVFMNGMRLSPAWASAFDGVHLLAPGYLEEAAQQVPAAASKFFAVPHFVDTAHFYPPSPDQKRKAREQFGLGMNDFIVLTAGPIGNISNKRTEHLGAEIAKSGTGALFVVAGVKEDGSTAVANACRQHLGDRFHYLGPVERNRMPALYQAADMYSLGSLGEPFSIAILEALASGLPVLHHHDSIMTWQTGAGGIPVAMDVPGSAAASLRRFKKEDGHLAQMKQQARDLAESRYAVAPIAAEVAQHLAQVCSQ